MISIYLAVVEAKRFIVQEESGACKINIATDTDIYTVKCRSIIR